MVNILPRLLKTSRLHYSSYRKGFALDELIFFVTYKCNFGCKTCFYKEAIDGSDTAGGDELNIDEIRKVSLSMGRFDRLLLSGGEPFLRDDIARICEVFYLQNKIRSIHLPTNGFFSEKVFEHTRKILGTCSGVNLIIGVSLDGLEETHDRIKGVRGSFIKAAETVRRLSTLKGEFSNLSTYIITVVNNQNLGEIIELSEFVKNNLPVDAHGPSPVRGEPHDKTLSPPSHKEWEALAGNLMGYHRYWNEKASGGKIKAFLANNRMRYLYNVYAEVLRGKRLPFRCQAGNIISVLEPNGDVKLCELTGAIGNIRLAGYDFKKVWFSDKADDMRGKIRDCACTHACFLNPSIEMDLLQSVRSNLFFRR